MLLCAPSGVTPVNGFFMPVFSAVVTNTKFPQTTGDEWPRPGSLVFQRMFFVSLHSTGGSAFGAAPVASGPRHCPHCASGLTA